MFTGILIALPLKLSLCLSACLPSFASPGFNYCILHSHSENVSLAKRFAFEVHVDIIDLEA